jgi:hypothetical protein
MPREPWNQFGDEPWDEEQWEAFFRENDRRTERYVELLYDFLRSNPRPEPDDAQAVEMWKERLRSFIDRKGWTRDDIALPFLWLDDADAEESDWAEFFPADESAFTWNDDEPFADADAVSDYEQLPVYQQAFALSEATMAWADNLPGSVKDSTLVQYCSCVIQIPAKVAKGHAFGYERDMIGGNIACVKRALAAANAALDLLRRLKREPYLAADTYQRLYEQTYEVRNALGIYVQELRERFDLGID